MSDNKVNILFLTNTSNIGGTERNILSYIDEYDRDKFSLFIGSFSAGEAFEYEVHKKTNQFIHFHNLIQLFYFLIKNKIDIIQLYGLRANILVRPLGKLAGCKIITAIRSVDSWRKWYHVLLDRLTSLWVDIWISNSYAGRDIAMKREKFPSDAIKVIHNGIELSKYKKLPVDEISKLRKHYGIADEDIVIGEVANLREMKGHVDIIDAIPIIVEKYENIKFFFAGADNSNGEIEKYAKQKNVSDHIIFAGYCENVSEILSLFDIFILPSLWEGLPTSIIEAMVMGLPVIASKVGGIPELIDDWENGILIEPKSPQQIASAVLCLLDKREILSEMGEKNIVKAWQNYDVKMRARDYEKIYMELINK